MRVGSLGLAAGCVAVGAAIGMLISDHRNVRRDPLARSRAGTEVGKVRSRGLEDRLAAVARSVRVRAGATRGAEATPPLEPEVDPEQVRKEARRRSEERIAHIQDVFEGDPFDPSWAPAAEAEIVDAVGSDALRGSLLREVECHTMLCRAEVFHGSRADFEVFARELPTLLDGMPRTTMKRLPASDGREQTILFAAREGYRMPVPP